MVGVVGDGFNRNGSYNPGGKNHDYTGNGEGDKKEFSLQRMKIEYLPENNPGFFETHCFLSHGYILAP